MARARNIKPGFYTNEDLVECSLAARLLYPGLWMLADREGRLEDRPKKIKMSIFPADNLDIESLLSELEQYGFIKRYSSDNKKVISIPNFNDHQSPHGREQDSVLPDEYGLYKVHERNKNGIITGKHSLVKSLVVNDSNAETMQKHGLPDASTRQTPDKHHASPPDSLNPSSLNPSSLNPSSLNSESPLSDSVADTTDSIESSVSFFPQGGDSPPKAVKKNEKTPPPTRETWNAYSFAYKTRYGVEPVRNATISGQLAQFVKRIGATEAPRVAAYYVHHNNQFYVTKMHTVGLLLADAEKLRTEWATNRMTTQTQARQSDKTAARGNVFNKLIDEVKANANN